ncbi:MAG TPA: outer membrane beta-barrel protein, partial [Lysobacter sp.]|nr:outer membrane beta-barrel protein [Lysobacter sp.]
MNKKLLCAALLGGLTLAGVANAQEFDDRWYITGSAGMNIQDNDRDTRDAPFAAIGVGKFLNPNWSLDGELNYQNPNADRNQDLNWSQYGVSLDLRRHFLTEGRNWNPYALVGLGYQRSEEEFDNFPSVNSPGEYKDGNLAAKVGVGLQADLGRVGVRTELAYRGDFNDQSVANPSENWFGDMLASVGVIVPLGAAPVAAVAPAPVAPSCADLDDDGDGVNNCDDKCPDSQAGQTIGPDGCPVPVSIDLKGVNFDFDKSTLRPDAVSILSEATQILQRYPELKVEVAGHTDSKGS